MLKYIMCATLTVVSSLMMSISISKNTVISVRQLLIKNQKPTWMTKEILNTMKIGVKHLKNVVKKDFLEMCLKKSLTTPEIESLANKIVGEQSRNKESILREEVKRIMKARIKLKRKDITSQKFEWTSKSTKVSNM